VDEEFGELQTQFIFFMQKEYRKIIKQNHGGKYMGFSGFGWNRCNWGSGDRCWGRGGCGCRDWC